MDKKKEEMDCDDVKKEAQRVMKALGLDTLKEFYDAPFADILLILQGTLNYNDRETKTWITRFERCGYISKDKADSISTAFILVKTTKWMKRTDLGMGSINHDIN